MSNFKRFSFLLQIKEHHGEPLSISPHVTSISPARHSESGVAAFRMTCWGDTVTQ